VLPDSTIPSGGEPDAVVNLLYQGQSFRRATSVNDFLTNSIGVPSFYIIGENDEISPSQGLTFAYAQKVMITLPPIPDFPTASNPGQLSFFVTYQVFNEGGAKDIAVSSTEYLTPGTITINYITSQ
jgi:pimeloyl-ACP methyl ester carboxylesterase